MHMSIAPHRIKCATSLRLRSPEALKKAVLRSLPPCWVCQAERREGPIVVVGGGAAGLTAAYFAAKAGSEVSYLKLVLGPECCHSVIKTQLLEH